MLQVLIHASPTARFTMQNNTMKPIGVFGRPMFFHGSPNPKTPAEPQSECRGPQQAETGDRPTRHQQ